MDSTASSISFMFGPFQLQFVYIGRTTIKKLLPVASIGAWRQNFNKNKHKPSIFQMVDMANSYSKQFVRNVLITQEFLRIRNIKPKV